MHNGAPLSLFLFIMNTLHGKLILIFILHKYQNTTLKNTCTCTCKMKLQSKNLYRVYFFNDYDDIDEWSLVLKI